jgi:membrane fusion protein, multidrug efflux system
MIRRSCPTLIRLRHVCRAGQICVIGYLVILCIGSVACDGKGPSAGTAAAGGQGMPPPTVRIASVKVQTVPIYGEFVGQTDAKEMVNIVPRVTGYLEKIFFREGSQIRKGDVLFQIEQQSYQAALESAEARLAQDRATQIRYQRDVARLEPLVKEQAATQQDLDTAVAGAAQQDAAIKFDQASIDTAQLNLSYTVIRSPIDGIIGRLGVTAGNLVSSGQTTPLATISSFDPMYVYFSTPEAAYLAFRRKYQNSKTAPPPVELNLILADNQPFPYRGRINFIDRTVDPTTGTLSIRAQFPNPSALLRPGEFTRVRFIVEERPNAVLVPKKAVTETLNTKSVLLVNANNKVAMKTITTDGEYQQAYIVHSGLRGGERVIVEGTQKATPGMTVVQAETSESWGK